MFTTLLRQRGLHHDALALGRAAVAAAPESMAIATQVGTALSRGIEAFHRPMLLDDDRNRAYARAIERAVRPGMQVLEIGTGAGLLALLAARAGALVTTCEANPMIAAAATQVVRENGLADRIRVISKNSTELTIPDDLPEPADILIHEIFGSDLVGEGVTDAVADARRRLLKPGAPSIPPHAAIRCALVREERAMQRSLAQVEGFDLSAFDLLTRKPPSLHRSRMRNISICSDASTALRMDFAAPPPFGPVVDTVSLVSAGGRIDGVVQWIVINLGNGETHENDPRIDGADSSWAAPFVRLPTPIDTDPGDVIDVTCRRRRMLLTLDAVRRPAGR